MDIKIVILIACSTTFSSVAMHEVNISTDANRTSRDIKVTQEINKDSFPQYQPPTFNYQTARQMAILYQDQQKQRYIQQQRMDMKNGLFARQLSLQHKELEYPEEWKPFQPTSISKSALVRQRKAKNIKLQNNEINKPKQSQTESGDLKEAGSENLELKKLIDRQDLPESKRTSGKFIYLDPSLVQRVLGNPKNVEVLGDIDGHQVSKVDYSALSDLIGKNPNVQLEGLQRLLKDTPGNEPMFAVIQNPQPFQSRDHTPITEKSADVPNPNTRPNIKVDHEQTPLVSSFIPTVPVDHNALENIQKQLDEVSKLEADEAFARAQEQARAHVAAQHKAIEKAQKDIFENLKKSLNNPQTLTSVQAQPQKQFLFSPTPVPVAPTSRSEIPKEITFTPEHLFSPTVGSVHEAPIPNSHERVVSNPTKISPNDSDDVLLRQYPSKNAKYYAPSHINQKTLGAQVESQNTAVLNNIHPPNPIVGNEDVISQKGIKNKNTQKLSSGQIEAAQTYQQFLLETKPEKLEETDSGDAKRQDGSENIQYAANYAFGYRIKDVKEGNDFGHQEKRQGKKAQGRYYVLLPDGRKQHVEYYADDSGYHAKISYDNVAHHR